MAYQEQYKGYAVYTYTRKGAEDMLMKFIKKSSDASLAGMIRQYVYPYPHIVRIQEKDTKDTKDTKENGNEIHQASNTGK